MSDKDLYRRLGLDASAESDIIDAVYRTLAKKYHPDTYKGDKGEGEKIFRSINEAYRILSDPIKRKKYDELSIDKQKDIIPMHKSANNLFQSAEYAYKKFKSLSFLDSLWENHRKLWKEEELKKLPYFFLGMAVLFWMAVILILLDDYVSR